MEKIHFYQVTRTTVYKHAIDIRYIAVENYATLADALKSSWWKLEEKASVADGESFKDGDTEYCQFHLNYIDNRGRATMELRKERFGYPEGCSVYQVVDMESTFIRVIVL